jgi:hypothetical protein
MKPIYTGSTVVYQFESSGGINSDALGHDPPGRVKDVPFSCLAEMFSKENESW